MYRESRNPRIRQPHCAMHGHGRCSGKRQAGQALILGMCLIVVVALLAFFQFSAGQATAARTRLVNATDAAAYSVGLWRARAMNYYAYSNRAIVANEVAIGQASTMVSYARYLHGVIERINRYTRNIPYLGQVTAAIEAVVELGSELTRYTAMVEVAARSGYNQAMAMSQQVVFLMTNPFSLSRVAQEVVAETDPSFHAFVVPQDVLPVKGLTRLYAGKERTRLRDVVMRSLDDFSKERSGRQTVIPCRARLERRGQTEMILDHQASMDRWQSYDTLSLHRARRFGCWRRMRESIPLGWGGAEAADDAKRRLDALDGQASGQKRSNRRAYRLASRDPDFWSTQVYFGLPSVRGLDTDSSAFKDNPYFPVLEVGIVGRIRGQQGVGTAQARGIGAGRVQPRDGFAGQTYPMMALAAAEVYFRRPPDDTGRIEYASLYSPYWQVRLKPVPEPWRQVLSSKYLFK